MKKVFFLAVFSLFGKDPSENKIGYRQLYWADFRGAIPKNPGDTIAKTFVRMNLAQEETDGRFLFEINAYFISDSSWTREKSERVLEHEQTHFRISQIMALKCRKALQPLQGGDSTGSKQAEELFLKYSAMRDVLNQEFDLATDHARDQVMEQYWERSIRTQLLNLETSFTKTHGRNQ